MKTIDIQIALTVFAIAFAVTSVIVIAVTGPNKVDYKTLNHKP